jgi:hypothetical protein
MNGAFMRFFIDRGAGKGQDGFRHDVLLWLAFESA